ncbi:DMT family transporter, partial [Streptomyces anulatus]|uniref:DMT family transporter n=1 Tax=Streptomyces anulatus TaxID=1892 RepID=UPI0036CACDC9
YLYLGVIGTALAYWLWFRGISRVPATSVAFLGLLSPVSAAVIGWIALGQALTAPQIIGLGVALAATVFGQLPSKSVDGSEAVAGERVSPVSVGSDSVERRSDAESKVNSVAPELVSATNRG